jgi:hypothetical protein
MGRVLFMALSVVLVGCAATPAEKGKAAGFEGSSAVSGGEAKECSVRFIAATHRRVKTCK